MNRNLIAKIIGIILLLEGACLLLPLLVSMLVRGDDNFALLEAFCVCIFVGILLSFVKVDISRLQTRDGFVCVALCWLALSAFGALPYWFYGVHFADALFETISGFTTTGATIFPSPASLPHGLQFWRAMTQWLGGMGILVMVLALLPSISQGSVNLMKAESPGPISTKLTPKTSKTAKILYAIYGALTAAEILCLRVAGMPWFDAVTTSMTTISTGGFSIRDESIAYYQSDVIVWIVILFMFLAAINFSLLFLVVQRKIKDALKSEELRWYGLIVLGAIAFVALDLFLSCGMAVYPAIREAAFHVVTLISTTGFGLSDFDLWSNFSKLILLLVMFLGGCAGSTAGGIKVSRIVLLFKGLRRELTRILHSRSVHPITLDGVRVEEDTLSSVSAFFFAFMLILLSCTAIVSIDGDFTTSFSASLSAISNVGPGLALVGPTRNYAFLSDLSKLTLSLTMLLGRLEIMPLLVLLMPSVWHKR